MPDQLVRHRPGDPGDVERRRAVFQHGQMADLKDVVEVAGIGCGGRDGFGPGLVARPPGKLRQCLSAGRVGGPRHVGGWQEFGAADQLDAGATAAQSPPPAAAGALASAPLSPASSRAR